VDKLEDLLKQSDYITLHTPYIKGVTHHLLNSETLAVCKPGVSILNFARGEIVDGSAVKVCVCVLCVSERERERERDQARTRRLGLERSETYTSSVLG